MDNIKQCKMCNKPFVSYGGAICQKCLDEIDDGFVKVRDYIYDHPKNVGIESISEETEVPENIILHLIKEQRLTIKGATGAAFACPSCGKPSIDGLCEDCRGKLAKQFSDTLPKASSKPDTSTTRSVKMHTNPFKK